MVSLQPGSRLLPRLGRGRGWKGALWGGESSSGPSPLPHSARPRRAARPAAPPARPHQCQVGQLVTPGDRAVSSRPPASPEAGGLSRPSGKQRRQKLPRAARGREAARGPAHRPYLALERPRSGRAARGAWCASARARGAVGEGARAGGGGAGRRGASGAGRGPGPAGRAGAGRAGPAAAAAGAGRARRGAEELPWVCLRIAARLGAQPALPDWTQTGAQPLAAARPASSSSCRAALGAPCPARPAAAPGPGGMNRGGCQGRPWSHTFAQSSQLPTCSGRLARRNSKLQTLETSHHPTIEGTLSLHRRRKLALG